MSDTELPMQFDNLEDGMEALGQWKVDRTNRNRRRTFENNLLPSWMQNNYRGPLPAIPTKQTFNVQMVGPQMPGVGGQSGLTIIFSEKKDEKPMYKKDDVLALIQFLYTGSGSVWDKIPQSTLDEIGVPQPEKPAGFGNPCGADSMQGCFYVSAEGVDASHFVLGETTAVRNGITYVYSGSHFLPYWKPKP